MPDHSDSGGEEEKPISPADGSHHYPDPGSPSNAQQSSDESGSSDGVLVELPGNPDQDSRRRRGDPDTGILVNIDGSMQEPVDESGRDDAFVDASDQMAMEAARNAGLSESMAMIDIGESSGGGLVEDDPAKVQLQSRLEEVTAECRKYKEEREIFGKEVVSLHESLQNILDNHSLLATDKLESTGGEGSVLSSSTPLHSVLSDCSKRLADLKTSLSERKNYVIIIDELHSALNAKDQEIQDLNSKASASSGSNEESANDAVKRLLKSLGSVIEQEHVSAAHSPADDISLVEKKTLILIENHRHFASQTQQLKQVLSDIKSSSEELEDNDLDKIFRVARQELLESKRKETNLQQNITSLEEENRKFVDQIERMRQSLEAANVETNKTKAELEQSDNKLAAAREKLSIAVTKGKSLVQHRDSLKQSLAEKMSDLEKCMQELQQKNEALQAYGGNFEELKHLLSEKTSEHEKCMQVLQQKTMTLQAYEGNLGELKHLLSDKTTENENCMQELQQKTEALQAYQGNLEELKHLLSKKTSDHEKCMQELQQKTEALEANEENLEELKHLLSVKTSEHAKCMQELQQNTRALLAHKGNAEELKHLLFEKTSEHEKCLEELQRTANDLEIAKSRIGDVDTTNNLVNSLEKSLSQRDDTLREIDELMIEIGTPKEMLSINVIDKIKWFASQNNDVDTILLENRKIRDAISSIELPENVLLRELDYQVNWLVAELTNAKGNIIRLQDEINAVQLAVASHQSEMSDLRKEIDHLELSLLEEKIANEVLYNELEDLKCKHKKSMQNLSVLSSDKDGLMKALLELSESTFDDKIEIDTSTIIEKCLIKINERSKPSITEIGHFERMQKVLYLTDLELKLCVKILEDEAVDRTAMTMLSDEQEKLSSEMIVLKNEKESIQKELERSEEKCSLIREKLSMAVKKGKGLVQEREGFKISLEEKESDIKNLKHALELKDSTIGECQEKIKNLSNKTQHIEKLEADNISLKDERDRSQQCLNESRAILENLVASIENISIPTIHVHEDPLQKVNLIAEHLHELEVTRISVSQELDKVKEEASWQSARLADAFATIKSLEDELSKASNHVSFIVDEKSALQQDKFSIEQELEKIKGESSSQSVKLTEAYYMIKSLEDELLTAEKDITQLNADRELLEAKSKEEIDELNAKLVKCKEELAGVHGSIENHSADINTQLGHLQVLIEDKSLFAMMIEQLSKKIEGLKKMNDLIQNMHNHFDSKGFNVHHTIEESALHNFSSLPKFEESASECEEVPSLSRIVRGLHSRSEFLNKNFGVFCKVLDEYIEVTLQTLQAATDKFVNVLGHTKSLEMDLHKLGADNETQQANLGSLQKELKTLLSACLDTTQELIESCDSIDSSYTFEKELLSGGTEEGDAGRCEKAAESLITAAKLMKSRYQQLSHAEKDWLITIDNLKNKLIEAELIAKNAVQEQMLGQERISMLERDLGASKELCSEMKLKLESYQAKENTLRDKEEEILSLRNDLERGIRSQELSESQMNALIAKVNTLDIPILETGAQATEVHISNPVEKLFYTVDKVVDMQQKINILTGENEDMQLTLESHVHEIGTLRKAVETINMNYEELELKKEELFEMTDGLERIIKNLGGYDALQNQKPTSAKLLLAVLDRLTTASSKEYENLKSRVHELGSKLQAKTNLIEELSQKVKILEGSIHTRSLQQEITKGRTIIEATPTAIGSEISEDEDVGPSGKNTASVSTAAQLRTMRKGSSDHLVLNIDSESDRLIASQDADAKGHVFKSLNTSGIIPKQGKSIADRIDGIWVSGGQILMRRPGARLGLIAYMFFMHLWLLGTIL